MRKIGSAAGLPSRFGGVIVAGALVAALLPLAGTPVLGAATKLVLVGPNSSTQVAGAPFVVQVAASDGSVVDTGFTGTVTVASTDPAATLDPSTYTYNPGDNGVKNFTVTLRTAGSHTVSFSSTGLLPASKPIQVVPGAPAALVYRTQPTSSVNGVALPAQPAVAIVDGLGNTIVGDSTTAVTLTLVPPEAGLGASALAGCTARLAVYRGVAAYAGCRVSGYGRGFRLDATGGGLAVRSDPFDVSSSLAFATTPIGLATGGIAFPVQPRVVALWNPTSPSIPADVSTNDDTTVVSLSLMPGTGASGATLTCDQAGNALRMTDGVAQFSGCRIDKASTVPYQIVATSTPWLGAQSSGVLVQVGPAVKVSFLASPAGAVAGVDLPVQPVVAITDEGGNVVTSGVFARVMLTIGSNPGIPPGVLTCGSGTLLDTPLAGSGIGRVSYTGCRISTPGIGYTLVATPLYTSCWGAGCVIPVLRPAVTAPFTVSAVASTLTLSASPAVPAWNEMVTFTARFGTAGANRVLELQSSLDRVSWSTLSTMTTNAAGVATASILPGCNRWYRAAYAPPIATDLAPGVSPTIRVVVRQTALLRPHSAYVRTAALGSSVTFSTTVRPIGQSRCTVGLPLGTPTVTYWIYRYTAGAWRLQATRVVTADAAGVARLTWRFSARGDWAVRSMANPTHDNANSLRTPLERYRVP